MVLWTSDKYITSIKNLPLVKNRHSSMEVMLKPTIRTNIHICVPVFLVCPILGLIWVLSSYISSATGSILVYTQYDLWVSDKYLAGIKNFSLSQKHTHNPLVLKNKLPLQETTM